jgi:hypothetical protein
MLIHDGLAPESSTLMRLLCFCTHQCGKAKFQEKFRERGAAASDARTNNILYTFLAARGLSKPHKYKKKVTYLEYIGMILFSS